MSLKRFAERQETYTPSSLISVKSVPAIALTFDARTRCNTQGNVEYVAVRAGKDECATPAKLVQNYVVCRLDKKLDVLLGFIKTHLKSKMIVFFTSCAQVCECVQTSR